MAERIQQLSESVADQIAAGEVIERPSSVVKELVENSLDAGASEIEVEFRDGGVREITVRDDGRGIAREDLPLAVKRHATSKIRSAQDLQGVSTLGFRGEALASIASVAHLEITSRTEDASEAYRLTKPPSGESSLEPAARKSGTTVTVRDLFDTVPARRRFLKTETTERKHILREVQRKALAATGVRFVLLEGDQTLMSVPAGTLEDRAHEVLGGDVAEHLVSVQRIEADWKDQGRFGLSGLVSDGEAVHHTRNRQFLFVNERPVRLPVVYRALSKVYEKLGLTDRHPVAVLFLDLPPEFIDVNVHPRKEEIRFDATQVLFRFVYDTVKDELETHFRERAHTDLDEGGFSGTQSAGESGSDHPFAPDSIARAKDDADREAVSVERDLLSGSDTGSGSQPRFPSRVMGQFKETFLVVERQGGLFLVDQHTAHEKILYEDYRRSVNDREATQYLSVPITLNLDRTGRETILERAGNLEDLGLVIEEFGGDSLVVQAVPSYLGRRSEDKRLVYDMVEEFLEWEDEDRVSDPADDMITIMACRSAVMRGDRLMPREQTELLEGLNELDFPGKCPHGRRIFYEVGNQEISRWFDRPEDDLCAQGS